MAAVEGRRIGPLHTRPVFAAAADAGVSPVGRWSRVASERQKHRLGGRSDLARQCQVATGCEVAELYRMQVAALGIGPRAYVLEYCRKDGRSARSCEATRYTMRHSLGGGASRLFLLAVRRLEVCGQGQHL